MNPKSPWKLKVIKVAKNMGVKDAAKQFKVAKETLQGWIDESAKFCDDIVEEGWAMELFMQQVTELLQSSDEEADDEPVDWEAENIVQVVSDSDH